MFKIFIFSVCLQTLVYATSSNAPIEYIGKFPYHVSVRDISGKHICGAAIIKTNIILAPGLCMNGGVADHIVAGSVDPTDTDNNSTQTIKIVRTERNIGFFGERYMILYFLDNALKFGYGVEPIKISKSDPLEMIPARITGFVKIDGETKLRSIEQIISKYNDCKGLLNHPKYNDVVVCTAGESKMDICKAYEETSLLACRGKSFELCGLPFSNRNFMCDNKIEENNIEGSGVDGNKQYIAGFVKIAAFQDWLASYGIM